LRYVPNGIDIERYRPDPAGRTRLRAEWGISADEIAIGIVARADPVKAHDVFIKAAQQLAERDARLRFLCIGVHKAAARTLSNMAAELGIAHRVRIEGPRDDLSAVYSALDVKVLCSHSEGFPNVVAEAMACGTPCAVTNAGDAVDIVGSVGTHAATNDPEALADAVQALVQRLETEGEALKRAARSKIADRFAVSELATRTLAEFESLLQRPAS
jgi:glycosyltransferase involved in cell wall biosynthesis